MIESHETMDNTQLLLEQLVVPGCIIIIALGIGLLIENVIMRFLRNILPYGPVHAQT